MSEWLCIGVGNLFRRDDGAGLVAAQRLQAHALPQLQVLCQTGEGAALIEAWQGAEQVILIDAVRTGREPGKIYVLDVHAAPIPADFFHYSTHAFSVAEAVELARVLDQLPPKFIIYGIEGADFGAGMELTPIVRQAVEQVVAQLISQVSTFSHQ